MRIHPVLKALVLGVAIGLCAVSQVRADELYGRIRGTVTDASGAVVPGATVTVTNQDTGISRTVLSQSDGGFEVVNLLAPGTYRIIIEKQGFRKSDRENVHLDVNQIYLANATLEVGPSTQEVTVEAQVSQINTTSMQLGTTIGGNTIEDIPLNGRNWIQLQQLQPGVEGGSDRFTGFGYSTNGAETQQNSFYVNGIDTADIALNIAGIIPSPDAIGEFHMVTSTINPEFGRNSGAIMNALIKSGTNQLHGDGFEFFRETSLDARNFFHPTTDPFHQNQFGGTVGGPVVLPHIYNGRNKTFFFFSYQGTRNIVPQAYSIPTVFTSDQRNGIFPDLETSTGISAQPLVGDDGTTYPAGTAYSTLFPTGTIPQADQNTLALKLMKQFVPPADLGTNEYAFSPSIAGKQDQYISRVDHTFSSHDSIWAYTFWERYPTTSTLSFLGANLPGFSESDGDHAQQYSLAWNHVFSSTTLNEARFGYFRYNLAVVNPVNAIDPTSYGFTGIIPQLGGTSIPAIYITGYFNLGFSPEGPQPRLENTYQFIDNFSKVVGRHTLKAGFTTDRFQVYNPFDINVSGNYSFGGIGAFSTGDPGADFLLGQPDSYSQGNGFVINARSREYYFYAQDEFKLRPNLTLTFGTGWDIETPYLNLYYGGKFVNAFRPGQQSTVFPGAPLGVLWPGDAGINSAGGVKTPTHDLAPRLGFAWSPGSSVKWSVHGGVGMYYNRTEEELALQNGTTPPFSLSAFGVGKIGGTPSLAAPYTGWCPGTGGAPPTACSTPNPFPYTPPTGSAVSFAALEPLALNTLSPNFGVPYSENYNLTIERQLSGSTTVSVAYVGNVGRHLEGNYELNPAGQAPGMNPVAAATPNCGPLNLGVCAPQTFRYNPQTTGLGSITQQSTEFNSNYNSLQVSLNKKFSNGLSFLAAYTWSRFFDEDSTPDNQDGYFPPGVNPFDLRGMYGPSDNDAPQRFVFSYDYTLPFYHFAHRFRRLTDDWKVGGITTFQDGFPIRLANTAAPSDTAWGPYIEYDDDVYWDRPNRSGVPLGIGNPRNYTIGGNPNYYFNPAAFAQAAPGTSVGDVSRNFLHGPGINNFDIAVIKDVHITESKYLEFRVETFNTFNHTQWIPYSYDPIYGTGGTVADINDARFGRVISASAPRYIQLAGKIYF
jgi:hypothetical protein